jgi:hypothetical protein
MKGPTRGKPSFDEIQEIHDYCPFRASHNLSLDEIVPGGQEVSP